MLQIYGDGDHSRGWLRWLRRRRAGVAGAGGPVRPRRTTTLLRPRMRPPTTTLKTFTSQVYLVSHADLRLKKNLSINSLSSRHIVKDD